MSNPQIQRRLSSRNPFRTPNLTPNPTGTSTTSSAPSYHTALPFSHTLLVPTPTGMSNASSAPSYHTAADRSIHPDDEDTPQVLRQLTLDDIPEDAPPAYSLTADLGGGETIAMQDSHSPLQPEPEPEPFVQPPQPIPPPESPSSIPESPISQLSNFDAPPSPTTSLQQQPRYGPPPGRPPSVASVRQQPRYDPPPGAPTPSRPRAASTSSGAGSTAPPADDGYPTSTPMPGHPLLLNGRTLVYPETHLCPKCSNTGYKNFDPSRPCRKCWDRFGKPFTSILASSPWGDQSSGATSESQHGRKFQRPLPVRRPSQALTAPVHPTPPSPSPSMSVPPPIPPRSSSMLAPPPIPPPPPRPNIFVPPRIPPPSTGPVIMPYGATPPPGAAVVMPGDSRIGGTLCWRCGGRGTTPFLIFDEMTCESCGGVGRLFHGRPQNNKHGLNTLVGAQAFRPTGCPRMMF
ncbi:hypothetical protein EI94DRAFT_1726685 [Lactarius quietus]|nr:hypothetical protein EI94DRAFT_1726685 [Lactarius quietus]